MRISNKVGPPVEGVDFFGRTKELKSANRLLNAGNSLLLAAPRRIGKSSFSKKLISQKREEGWKCIYIDLEQTHTEEGFLELIIESIDEKSLWKSTADAAGQFIHQAQARIREMKVGPVTLNLENPSAAENLYKKMADALDHSRKTLIVIDELTLFLGFLKGRENGEERVRFILNWLRSLRQISGSEIRWLYAGSVGLNNFTKQNSLSYSINDLIEFKLDELDSNEALELLSLLISSVGMRMSEDVRDYTLEKLTWHIPYFIQLIVSQLIMTADSDQVSREDIDNAYRQLSTSSYLSTWSERLSEYDNEHLARILLNELSLSPKGITSSTLIAVYGQKATACPHEECERQVRLTLEMLYTDGYLININGKHAFRSPLLRDYWKNKFCS